MFNHFNFLGVDVFDRALLRYILAQKAIDMVAEAQIKVIATLQVRNVALTLLRFINQRTASERFAVVVVQRLD